AFVRALESDKRSGGDAPLLLPAEMRGLEEATRGPLAVVPEFVASAAADGGGTGSAPDLSGWITDCHGLWHNLSLIVPSALFVAFLAAQARRSLTKLSYGRSYIMISYYGLLWAVSLLNLLWCVLQSWQCTPGKELGWNLLSLLTTSGMLFLEVSLVAFLLQGNQASGVEALTRTFIISGVIISVDILLKICLHKAIVNEVLNGRRASGPQPDQNKPRGTMPLATTAAVPHCCHLRHRRTTDPPSLPQALLLSSSLHGGGRRALPSRPSATLTSTAAALPPQKPLFSSFL
ncbi:hypothetical protein Taro_049748, partial [Colocasia esculenta]|nr:hypothetical protein [Colocasia esculenta]